MAKTYQPGLRSRSRWLTIGAFGVALGVAAIGWQYRDHKAQERPEDFEQSLDQTQRAAVEATARAHAKQRAIQVCVESGFYSEEISAAVGSLSLVMPYS